MKKILSLLGAMTLFTAATASADDHAGKFRHVVLFKYNEDVTDAQKQKVVEKFGQLPEKIDAIVAYEWGSNQTVEADLAQGYDHCFLVTFKDKAGLETYLPHPDHQKFVSFIKPLLAEVHVFDYVVGE